MSLQTIYDVPCPFCGAGFDRWCVVASGRNAGEALPTPHVARRTAYRIAKASEPEPVRPGA